MKAAAALLFAWACSWAQSSAIVSLILPPPGGDGYAALQAGGAFPTGAASMYYNPALLAELERSTGSQVHFSQSWQDILPVLNIKDLDQAFWGLALAAPDPRGFDVGVGFFRNRAHFGTLGPDSDLLPGESVQALGLGLRLGLPISVGGTAKFYHSRFRPGDEGYSYGWAFDLGLLVQPRIYPLGFWNLRSLELIPALGITQQNLGPDATYSSLERSDPLPTTLRHSLGITLRFADLVEFSAGEDLELENHWRADASWEANAVRGFSIHALGYRFSQSFLDDPTGGRSERHTAHAFEFNLAQVFRLTRRLQDLDFASPSKKLDRRHPIGTVSALGLRYRANPRLVFGTREIEARDFGIRQGQKALFWSLSL
jgi:hypothetical protein